MLLDYLFDVLEMDDEEIDDELYEEAKKLVAEAQKASASYLQRRLRIGYARAARILDLLEEQGFIGPGEGAKPREILAPHNPPVEPLIDESESEELTKETDEPLDEEPTERG